MNVHFHERGNRRFFDGLPTSLIYGTIPLYVLQYYHRIAERCLEHAFALNKRRFLINLYEQIKAQLTPRCVTERYGAPIHRGNMICCPFHSDKTPSMKLYSDHFYCFGCQKSGDVIDLAAGLFELSNLEAAKKLAADFGIRSDIKTPAVKPQIPYEQTRQFREDEQEC